MCPSGITSPRWPLETPSPKTSGGPNSAGSAGLRVLMVHPHPLMRAVLTGLLRRLEPPAQIREAISAVGLWRRLGEQRWDVVVLSLDLPDEPGLPVCRRIQAQHPGTPVLLVGLIDEAEYRKASQAAGAAGFVAAGAASQQLLPAVRTLATGQTLFSEP